MVFKFFIIFLIFINLHIFILKNEIYINIKNNMEIFIKNISVRELEIIEKINTITDVIIEQIFETIKNNKYSIIKDKNTITLMELSCFYDDLKESIHDDLLTEKHKNLIFNGLKIVDQPVKIANYNPDDDILFIFVGVNNGNYIKYKLIYQKIKKTINSSSAIIVTPCLLGLFLLNSNNLFNNIMKIIMSSIVAKSASDTINELTKEGSEFACETIFLAYCINHGYLNIDMIEERNEAAIKLIL